MKIKRHFNRQRASIHLILAVLFAAAFNLNSSIVSANNSAGESRALNGENDSPAANVELASLPAPNGEAIGRSIAVRGNTVIIGAQYQDNGQNADQGAAYIFVRTGATWTFQQKLVAPDGGFGHQFGNAVAINGDTALVGAWLAPDATANNRGAVYVFTRSGTIWTFQQKLAMGDVNVSGLFGCTVAMTDTTAVIAAPNDKVGSNNLQGALYIYTRSGSSWGFQAKVTATDGEGGDNLGGDATFSGRQRVAVSGDTVVAGSVGGAFANPQKVYVFVRSGTSWSQQQKLTAFDSQPGDNFGTSVGISNNTLVVGADSDDIETRADDGSAYVYTRNGTVWTLQQKLVGDGDNPTGEDTFGYGVAISGEAILVGVPFDDSAQISARGAGFLFRRAGTTWTFRAKLVGNNFTSINALRLGENVALDGNTAAAFAQGFGTGNVGAGFVFDTETGNTTFDFDGDGKADVSVFRPSNGTWYLNQSTSGFAGFSFGISTDKIVPADYDGDGRTDIAVFRDGVWYLQRSSLGFTGVSFGDAGDVPQPADYDGDGKADVAVFRPSTGVWYLLQSAAGFAGVTFGQNGDRPVAADYEGDGRSDIAVYRGGVWYIQRSSLGFTGITFGDANDKPVPADYDGDGLADIAVFRPSNGTWYLQRSSAGFTGVTFGSGTDTPAPADYDGDRKADVSVFRPSNGTWYLLNSTSGLTATQFGANADKPIPSAFVP